MILGYSTLLPTTKKLCVSNRSRRLLYGAPDLRGPGGPALADGASPDDAGLRNKELWFKIHRSLGQNLWSFHASANEGPLLSSKGCESHHVTVCGLLELLQGARASLSPFLDSSEYLVLA